MRVEGEVGQSADALDCLLRVQEAGQTFLFR